MSRSTRDTWWHSANGHLFVFVSTDLQSAEQAWIANSGTEQSPSFHSTGDVAPTPEEPASRGALNPFLKKTKQKNSSFWCYISCFALLTYCKSWTQNMKTWYIQKSVVLVNCRLPLHSQRQLFSGGSGITHGVMLGTALSRIWQALPTPCFGDL